LKRGYIVAKYKENLKKTKQFKNRLPGKEMIFWSLESFLLIQRLKLDFQNVVKVIQH
jgi:hypothetical protein